MDIDTMPHAMYFSGNTHTVTIIYHVPYQPIQYNDKGMFPAQLMDDTPIQVFIDNRLECLGIIQKGLTGYSSPVVQVKRKNQNLYRVCSDFCILNEKLLKINHAFPLV